jgi:hypothetical protein
MLVVKATPRCATVVADVLPIGAQASRLDSIHLDMVNGAAYAVHHLLAADFAYSYGRRHHHTASVARTPQAARNLA